MAFDYPLTLPLDSPTLSTPALSSSYSTDCPTPPISLGAPFEQVVNISSASSRAPTSSQQYNSDHSYFPLMNTCPRRANKPPPQAELYSALYNVLQGKWKEQADKLEGIKGHLGERRKRSNSDGDVRSIVKKVKVEERKVKVEEAYESEDEETPFLFSVPDLLPDESEEIPRRTSLPTSSTVNPSKSLLLSYSPLPPPTLPPMNPFLQAFHFPASSLYIPPPPPSSPRTITNSLIKLEDAIAGAGAAGSSTSITKKDGLLSVVRGFEDLLKERATLFEGLEGMKRGHDAGR